MHVATTNFNGNPNIGLFLFCTNKYCLVPKDCSKKLRQTVQDVLKVPVHEVSAAGTSLLGVFFAGNDEILLVPEIMFDHELQRFRDLEIKYKVVRTRLTALGNNLLIVGKKGIASTEYDEETVSGLNNLISFKKGKVAGLDTVGSLAVGTSKGLLVSSEAAKFEERFLKDNLGTEVTKGTINFGSNYVSAGIIVNNNGFLVGDVSGGPEVQNADEALGFLG